LILSSQEDEKVGRYQIEVEEAFSIGLSKTGLVG